uniref:BEACH domain-containing protein n=1 Tax=Macrostomum lignano TaxID=282301 RepID=A0A1I8FC66_9PLAT
ADSSGDAPQSASWSFDEVKEVHLRRYELRDNALEIFLANGAAYLLAFQSPRDRDEVARVVDGLELDSRVRQLTVDEAQRQWVTGQMSNFEYLAFLNTASGRSYNDLMQYPPATFRDLARPIGTQDDSAVARHRDKYEVLDRQYRELGPDHATPPYHYSSHYSNSGTVLHYLVRLPPYTQLFTVYQDRHFDLPDRTFHSIRTSWRLSSKLSDSDVKELIPEFFCLPEFFINSEELDFGVKQSGVRVDNVELPPWPPMIRAGSSSFTGPPWSRRSSLRNCTSKAALSSVNLFHPYTYFGAIDLDQIDDPVRRRAIETMIKTYGQTPKQLFRSPHQPPVAAGASLWPGARGFRRSIWKLLRLARLPGPAPGALPGWGQLGPACVVAWCEQLAAPVAQLVLKPSPVGPSAPEPPALDKRWARLRRTGWATRVTAAAACGWRVFCGLRSGLLRVFSVAASSTGSAAPASSSASGARGRAGGRIDWLGEAPVPLLGHRSAVTAAHACPEFALLATGDAAGRVLLWDTNQVAYVRCCDLLGQGSQLTVYTANGALVGSVSSGGGGGGGDRITCAVGPELRLRPPAQQLGPGDLAFIRPGLASPAPLLRALRLLARLSPFVRVGSGQSVFVLEAPVDPYLSGRRRLRGRRAAEAAAWVRKLPSSSSPPSCDRGRVKSGCQAFSRDQNG